MVTTGHVSAALSTETSDWTLVLTATSPLTHVFTGTAAHSLRLPGAVLYAGQQFTVINNRSLSIIVRSADNNIIALAAPGRAATFTARLAVPATNADWLCVPLAGNNNSSPSTVALRDANANITADAFIATPISVTNSGGTTTLTVDSSQTRVFTGSTNQTVVLPTTSIIAGQQYTIINNSTGTVTVNASGGALVHTLAAGESVLCYALANTPTTAAQWRTV